MQVLLPYPSNVSEPPGHVEVSMAAAGDTCCRISYRIAGQSALALPARCANPGFADELWQRTCCEAFVATAGQSAYREFNFSPSGQWAIYDFADYRQAMRRHLPDIPPRIDCQTTSDGFILTVDLPIALLGPPPWQIGLCCILKTTDGSVDYRALKHPASRPDFHHRASFALPLDRL